MRRLGTILCMSLVISNGALANPISPTEMLDGLSSVRFDSGTGFALGDTISILRPSSPLKRCVEYDQTSDVKSDTAGSVASNLNVYIVKSLDDFERNTTFSFATSASMGFGFGQAFGASGDMKQNGQFEQFVHRERQSLLLVLEANADQGREFISNYKLRKEYAELASAGNPDAFIRNCGTHFIRAVKKRSGIRVIFNVSNLTENSKRVISYHFETSASAKGTIKLLTAEARSSASVDIADTLKLASNFGKVTYEVQATGGLGVSTLGKTLKSVDLSNVIDFKKVLDALADATADFSNSNAAPEKFILVPHPELQPGDIKFDAQKYVALGAIYKAILRVNELVELYSSYRDKNVAVWNKYFKVQSDRVRDLRESLLKQYAQCRDMGKCYFEMPSSIEGVMLDSVAVDGHLRALCPIGNKETSAINSKTESSVQYLSSIVVDWTGSLRYFPQIDISGAELYRITPTLTVERIPLNRGQISWQQERDDSGKESPILRGGQDSALALITFSHFIPEEEKIRTGGQIDLTYLQSFRANVARSLFVVRLPLRVGLQVEEVLGFPDMKNCKLFEEKFN